MLNEPDVTVESRALVEPPISKGGVHANHEVILFAIVEEIGDIEAEGSVAVVVAADKATVHKNERTAESPIELQHDPAALVAGGNIEHSAIPADAGFRLAAAKRFVTVRFLLFVPHKGQFHRPIMRQIQRAPL